MTEHIAELQKTEAEVSRNFAAVLEKVQQSAEIITPNPWL